MQDGAGGMARSIRIEFPGAICHVMGSEESRAHGEQEAQRMLQQGLEAAGL